MSDHSYGRPMLDRVFRHAELMDRMMERVGIDAAAVARLEMGMAFWREPDVSAAAVSGNAAIGWLGPRAAHLGNHRSFVATASSFAVCGQRLREFPPRSPGFG
jgi:hypothetical protein